MIIHWSLLLWGLQLQNREHPILHSCVCQIYVININFYYNLPFLGPSWWTNYWSGSWSSKLQRSAFDQVQGGHPSRSTNQRHPRSLRKSWHQRPMEELFVGQEVGKAPSCKFLRVHTRWFEQHCPHRKICRCWFFYVRKLNLVIIHWSGLLWMFQLQKREQAKNVFGI